MVTLAMTTPEAPSAVQLVTPPADPLVGLEVDQRQLDERIYDALKEKILQSELAPGTALTIRSVAQHLGVSVTPVRDALRRLQAEGLVQMQGRGETTVARLEPGEIDDILDLRLALELHATRRGVTRLSGAALKHLEELLAAAVRTFRSDAYHDYPAASRLDQEFHSVLVQAAGNERLTEMYETLGARVQIARVYYTTAQRRPRATYEEHRAILEAYRQRDPTAAVAAVETHITHTRQHIAHLLGQQTEGGRADN